MTGPKKGLGREGRTDGGLIKVAGSMVLTGIGAMAGAAVLRSGSRSILNAMAEIGSNSRIESEWLKKAGRTMAALKSEAAWLDDALKSVEGIAGEGKAAVSYFETLTDAQKFTANGLRPDYVKRLAVSRAASYARRAPYELPAAYITQRFFIEREKTKQDIAEGRYNPLNPIDVIGDAARRSASLIAGDIALYGISPLAKATDRWLSLNNKNYIVGKAAVKVASQESIQTLLRYTDNARLVSRATAKTMADITKEGNQTILGYIASQEVPDLMAGQGMRRPVATGFTKVKAAAKQAGKTLAGELEDQRKLRRLYGQARDATPRAHQGTDLKMFSGFTNEAENGFFASSVMGRYIGGLEDNVAWQLEAAGHSSDSARKLARRVVDANSSRLKSNDIVGSIINRGAGQRLSPDTPHNPWGTFDDRWELAMHATLGRETVAGIHKGDLSGANALRSILNEAAALPDPQTASSWVAKARRYTAQSNRVAVTEYVRQTKRGKLNLTGSIGAFETNKKEHMALEAFDALGVDMWGTAEARTQGLWHAWETSVGDVDQLAERTRQFLVNRGRAYDRPLGGFNMFGMRRVTTPEMASLEYERRRTIAGKNTRYGRHSRMFGDEFRTAMEGVANIERTAGRISTSRMLGEKGVYLSVTGDVVDARWLHEMPMKAIDFVEREMKVPITNFNPLQMFGVSSMLQGRGQTIKFQRARAGFFERKIAEKARPGDLLHGLDANQPLFQIGKSTYGMKNGSVGYIGEWNWFSNSRTTMFTSIARKMSGMAQESERPLNERRGFFGGRWFEQRANEIVKETGEETFTSKSLRYASKFMQSLDFEQSAEKSVLHNMVRRVQRSYDHRIHIPERLQKGFLKPKGNVRNADFLPNLYEDVVERGMRDDVSFSVRQRQGLYLIDQKMSAFWDEKSPTAQVDLLSDMGFMPHVTVRGPQAVDSVQSAIRQSEEMVNLPAVQRSDARHDFQVIVDELKRITGIGSGRVLGTGTLDAHADHGVSLLGNVRVGHQVQQRVAELNLMLVRLTEPEQFAQYWQRIGEAYQEGMIDHSTLKMLRANAAAVDMRISKSTSLKGQWIRKARGEEEAVVGRVREALSYIVGPGSTGMGYDDLYRRAGGGLKGLKSLFESTVGNKGWRSAQGVVVDHNPPAINPFKGATWIGLPTFSGRMGLTGGARQIGRVLGGQMTYEYSGDDADPARTLAGVFFGQTKHSDLTMGSLAGTHVVSRVGEALDTVGFGIQAWKYKNPADLFMRGLILKRAMPAVLGIAAFDTLSGIPGVGKKGAIGAAATALGPGLGMARATAFSAVGLNKFFGTFSDVTGQDEDARTRRWANTPQEELRYWQEGEVPIRQGRFWILGNSRFKGGKTNYYRPNWYRMFMSDYRYDDTSDKGGVSGKSLYGSRAERLLFGYDFSPMRPLSPYHYENKHYEDRPYPVSGDYFTGPWGPLTPMLNASLGAVLKPKRYLHTEQQAAGTSGTMGGGAGIGAGGLGGTSIDLSALITRANGNLVLSAYESGRLNVGQVVQLGYQGAKLGSKYVEELNRRTSGRRGSRSQTRMMVRAAQRVADQNMATSSSGGMSTAIVEGLNKTQTDNSGRKIGNIGGAYSTKEGYIPTPYMYLMGKTPYPEYASQVPLMSQAMKPGLMNYRMGEIGYTAQEWGGFYGFMLGSVREVFGGERDYAPERPVLQSADRMYGSERGFWDLDLGGLGDFTLSETNVQLSEITRRFIPHKRNQINQINDIPNRMPLWMPGQEDVINYRTGDPYVKIKLGEARLPGAGYEALNGLHPDAFGAYGGFDRFKILADIAPWSGQYNLYRQAMEKSDLTDDMRKRVTEIKKQVAERRKKIAVSEYMWQGRLGEVASGELVQSDIDPNLFMMEGQANPIRMAGVRFSKTPEGKAQAKAFYEANLKGRRVSVRADKNGELVRDNREKTLDAIVMAGGRNINRNALEQIRSGELMGSESQSKAFVDNMVRYAPGWQMLGRVWERVAHAEVPIIGNKFGRRSAAEHYERRMVYGKVWQPWETPIKSFLEPAWQTNTKDRGWSTVPVSAILTGWVAGMFFGQGRAKNVARFVGATAGGLAGAKNQLSTLIHGQRDVPLRRKKEWAVDEYIDILNYIKYSNMYQQARRAAIEQEGVDPEAIADLLGKSSADRKKKFTEAWEQATVGRKPDKPAANKVFSQIGPYAAEALQYRKRMSSTMYGFDLSDDFMSKTAGIPKRYQPLVEGWLSTSKDKQKRLLDILPRPVRRLLEEQWGMPVEEARDLVEYFKTHELPGPDWEGWLPQVDMDEIKVKVINNEGLDHSEYGYYPNQVSESLAQPWSYPDMFSHPRISKDQIIEQLEMMGVRDIQIKSAPAHGEGGVNIRLINDRRSEVMDTLKARFG